MGKTFYSEYAAHCIRVYLRHGYDKLTRLCDQRDWVAAHDAFEKLTDERDKEALKYIYGQKGNTGFKVTEASIRSCIPESELWKLMASFEYKVAENRGLR